MRLTGFKEAVSQDSTIYYKSILADLTTPVAAFLKVAREAERAFLLESVEKGERIGRYSFIGVDPHRSYSGSFEGIRTAFPPVRTAPVGLPPFTGGAVGVFSYDMVRELERLPSSNPADSQPHVSLDFYSTVLAFDHLKHQIIIMSHDSPEKVLELTDALCTPHPEPLSHPEAVPFILPEESPLDHAAADQSNFTRADFCRAVETAQEYILRGDIFQVVLSQRFEAESKCDPFQVYRALRYINPSPYLFYLKMGDTSIVGSSPEMLLKVTGNQLEYRPIAGTRRRGRTQEEEQRLERELLGDEKERAEHLMLVDLGRNDLGRVSQYGSVVVEEFMSVEKYSHVIHLVSSLKGTLREELDRFDALAACFPAGTVSGAPKVRAMEIIEELEPVRRGTYAGSIGYLDFSGNLDTCIAIRTLVFKNGRVQLQAGAGIVADSRPEHEDLECHNKARALFRALQLADQMAGA